MTIYEIAALAGGSIGTVYRRGGIPWTKAAALVH